MEEYIFKKADSDDEEHFLTNHGKRAFTVTPIEDSVIKKAIEGDEAAFETLFMGTYRYVFATVRKYLRHDEDIYDAIQNTYLRVYKGFSRLESVSSFYPWLHRIAENCAKDILAANGGDITVSIDDELIIADEDKCPTADITADIADVLMQLPAEQAELLIRVYYDKMRVSEIAIMSGIPATTVYNRLRAAKKKLKELLKIRGIEKPIYGGELISMVSAAIRNAIGTELLSMAVAEERLQNVKRSADKKGAFVVATFARKMRNRAAKRIANSLMLITVLLTVAALIAAAVFINNAFKNSGSAEPSSDLAAVVPSSSADESKEDESLPSSALPDSNLEEASSDNESSSENETLSNDTSSKYDFFPMIPEGEIGLTGSLEDKGNFGTFSEDGALSIATTKDAVYAVSNGALVSVPRNATSPITYHCNSFGSLYTEKSSFLNVYDGRAYWINTDDNYRFILNRANLDGSENYSVVFEETECTYLTKFLVAEDGVYFTAGIHNDYDHTDSGTLYRTDFDFFVKDRKSGIADYAIVGERLYYIEGKRNYGNIYYADRNTFNNIGSVFTDHLRHGSLYTFGDYLVASRDNPYGHTEGGDSSGYRIIDTRTNETVRRVEGEGMRCIEILDVSGYNGGTIIYRRNNELLVINIESGEIREYTSDRGTVFGDYKYYLDKSSQSLKISNVEGKK